ncbi:MAG: MarR family transcriptional regulator [Desulfofustis sp.]|jgi:MarR family 2-MHQ and catechol resistance regulon transcriptional repressor|nr:MarR family transcriptional regulator [Desulfofustis sp.]
MMTPQQKQALTVFVKMMRAAESLSVSVHRQLADEDLTVSQFGVLEALFHKGPMCQKDLAGKILKSTGNITMVIDNLEKRGLVERRRSETDRRFIQVLLTVAGRELIARIFPEHAARVAAQLDVLNRKELEDLGALLKKVGLAAATAVSTALQDNRNRRTAGLARRNDHEVAAERS